MRLQTCNSEKADLLLCYMRMEESKVVVSPLDGHGLIVKNGIRKCCRLCC